MYRGDDPGDAGIPRQAALPWRAALLCAAGAFVLSRALVFVLVIVPALLEPAATHGPPSDRVVLAVDRQEIAAHLRQLTRANDAGWYRDIATSGYERREFTADRQANWAFFPMLPLAWAAATFALGDGLPAALLVPNVAFFFGLAALYLLCGETGRDAGHCSRATYAAAMAPCSYFFSFPWTESLFFCAATVCLLAATRRCWWLVALAGAVATATRFPGIFLLPAVLLLCRQQRTVHLQSLAACSVVSLGALLFAAHLHGITGNALAFIDIQSAWGRSLQAPVRAVGIVALRPWELAIDWNFRHLNLALVLLSALAVRRFLLRREFAFAAFLGLGIGAALASGTLTSMARYSTALFPLCIALADWTATPQRERVLWIVSTSLLAAMAIAFGFGLTFAAA